jgi:N-acetylglucosamine-6-phosphate deacetylase
VLEETLMSLVIRHGRVVSSTRVIEDAYILIENGVIVEVDREPFTGLSSTVINAEGLIVMPGFIDTHTHGIKGLDATVNREPSKILEMAKHYSRHGVTGFLPTTVTAPFEELAEACGAVREAMSEWRSNNGARIIGIHLEGPYLNPEAAGAQNKAYIHPPNIEEFKKLVEASGNTIKQVTIAPELEGAGEFITFARSMGIVVSAGHTHASYEEGLRSIEIGVSKATHLFNGMTRFQHREPGIVLALLQSPSVYLEIIVDFVHLHPAVVKMVIDYASPRRVVLITDSIAATDMPDGEYELGGLKVIVKQGICRLADTGGLAGSTLTMDKAVKNISRLGYGFKDLVLMASKAPAESIRLYNLGDIRVGYQADFVLVDDDMTVVKTMINGDTVFEK